MSVMTRAITAFAVLSVAAIPVAALTIKNTSDKDVTVGVHTGTEYTVYTVPAGGSVDPKEDCSAECAITGPWGYSRLVAQNATIETDGTSLVTAEVPAPAATQALVPQNPEAEPPPTDAPAPATTTTAAAEAAPAPPAAAAAPAPAAPRKRAAKPRRPAKQATKQAKKGGPAPGSFQLLFQGPGKQ